MDFVARCSKIITWDQAAKFFTISCDIYSLISSDEAFCYSPKNCMVKGFEICRTTLFFSPGFMIAPILLFDCFYSYTFGERRVYACNLWTVWLIFKMESIQNWIKLTDRMMLIGCLESCPFQSTLLKSIMRNLASKILRLIKKRKKKKMGD